MNDRQAASRFRQTVLLRARDVYMRSMGRSTLAATLLLVQQILCASFASALADRFESLSIIISGYSFNWIYPLVLFVIYSLFGPIMLGVSEFFVFQLHTRNGKILSIFNWFGDPARARIGFKFGLFQSLILVLSQLIGEIPAFIFFKNGLSLDRLTEAAASLDPAAAQLLIDSSGTMALIGLTYLLGFLVQIPLLRLIATEYLLVGSPHMSLGAALKESNSLMKGKIGSFMLTVLTVLPIIFFMSACGLLFFIGYGFYFMVRSSFIDTLIISRFIDEHGDIVTVEGKSVFSSFLHTSPPEETAAPADDTETPPTDGDSPPDNPPSADGGVQDK